MTQGRWAIIAAAVIAVGAFQPFYLKVLTVDRARMHANLVELPYSKTPGLRIFLERVRAHTNNGDSIALAAPYPTWDGGYDYAYVRSQYLLAGRRVLALLDSQNRPLPQNLSRAKYVAAYRLRARVPGFQPVWDGPQGTLLRRVQ